MSSSVDRLCMLLGGLLACTLMLPGCTTAVEDKEALEHHHAPYRPATYADAVTQLRLRYESLGDPPSRHESDELRDIITWLPQLAADSPMKKTAWDDVNKTSRQLAGLYETDLQQRRAGTKEPQVAARYGELVNRLATHVPDSVENRPATSAESRAATAGNEGPDNEAANNKTVRHEIR